LTVSMRILLWALLTLSTQIRAENWPMFGHDLAHTSFNAAEKTLGPNNVAKLAPAWSLSLNVPIASAPTLMNGVLYFGDWYGQMNAIRASDGASLWIQYIGESADPGEEFCPADLGVTAQPVVQNDVLYGAGGDSAMYAMDRTSGRILWRLPLGDPQLGAYIWSSPLLLNNSLFVGVASLGDCPKVEGSLARISLERTPQPVFRFMVPQDDLGGGIWSSPAYDALSGNLFITTGDGESDPDRNLWGAALLSMNAQSLEINSYFFLPGDPNMVDGDQIEWGSSPVLFAAADGTPMVAATAKDGLIYALDRGTLEPLWTRQLAIGGVCPECGGGAISTPAFDGNVLYVGAGQSDPDGTALGSLYALDPSTGEIIWSRALNGTVLAPVTVANGVVYVSTTGGAMAFNASDGGLLWTDGGIWGGLYSQLVVADGVLYTTYFDGHVVAWKAAGLPAKTGSD
jgi:outer membrane protein assembly factor BamB